jgi:epoxyqueuosine reductase
MGDLAAITQRVLDRCRDLGFALAGVCEARPTQYETELKNWLAAEKHGEMQYLNRNVELRVDPDLMVPGAKSIICVADRYDGERPKQEPRQAFGRIARYARGNDSHNVMRKRMASLCRELRAQFPKDSFRACVDTAPVLEREFAQRAGLGAVGKNTLLIQRGVGSWLLLGEIITSLPLAASRESDPDPCGTCTRCINACPTKAITPWSVDATRCISYLTIEHRGAIDEEFHEAIGDWIFGCDICQEVCPHNQPTERTQRAAVHPAYEPRHDGFNLLDVLNWDESARQQAFANSAMKRAKLNMMKRNAIIAAGNAKAEEERDELRKRIGEIAADVNEDELVRTTARAVLARFDSIKAADTGTAV